MSRVPKNRICFGEKAYLNFHMARFSADGLPSYETTQWMIDSYPTDIQMWLEAKGGLAKMPSYNGYWTLTARELWKMGYRKCGN